ncbi:MAG TPA: WYL domain-containing protein [Lachnospiraceae bacterium]|nr:WYL domain-containing protein [Lachnospiraceae bacterium]
MELFSEIYSCYYQVLRHLLCSQQEITIQKIRSRICNEGFAESMLSIIPKLESGEWNLFTRKGDLYLSKITAPFTTPLSHLQKSYLKAILSDPRIKLFLDRGHLDTLNDMLAPVTPLWQPEQFYYFDQFIDGDPYDDETYRHHFHTLLQAQKKCRYVDIDYNGPTGKRVHHHYIPARLEYSVKNNRFRLIALKNIRRGNMKLEILNIARIQHVQPLEKTFPASIDLNTLIRRSYYREPLTLHITNQRNALERTMLHFANYEKNTVKINDNTYECRIYYNQTMETELLIEVLSFGPMLTVTGNERFLALLKKRLQKQRALPIPDEHKLSSSNGFFR